MKRQPETKTDILNYLAAVTSRVKESREAHAKLTCRRLRAAYTVLARLPAATIKLLQGPQ